eukprot:jgi/Botrbrau1/17254/Bobra.0015s0013.1
MDGVAPGCGVIIEISFVRFGARRGASVCFLFFVVAYDHPGGETAENCGCVQQQDFKEIQLHRARCYL